MSIITRRNLPITKSPLAAGNIALLYVDGETYGEGQAVAEMYAAQRNVPLGNIQAVTVPGWSDPITNGPSLSNANAISLAENVVAALQAIGRDIKCIALCGYWPASATNSDGSAETLCSVLRAPYFYQDVGAGGKGPTNILSPSLTDWHYNLDVDLNAPKPTGAAISNIWQYAAQIPGASWEAVRSTEFKPNYPYSKGDRMITQAQYATYGKSFSCVTAGTSGSSEPPTLDIGQFANGTSTWSVTTTLDAYAPRDILSILPDNRMQILAEAYAAYESNWAHRMVYYVVGLAAPYVEAGRYTGISSPLDIVTRMVTDAKAVESLELTDLPGTGVIDGSSTGGVVGSPFDAEMAYLGKSMSTYWHTDLSDEDGEWPDSQYVAPVSDSMPPGATTLTPGQGTFVNIPDVFIHHLGRDTYFTGDDSFPIKDTEITYKQGAIASSSQSCGGLNGMGYSIDYYNEPVNIPASAEKDIKSGAGLYTVGLTFGGDVSAAQYSAFYLKYSGASVVATAEATDVNEWTLIDDSGTVVVAVGADATLDEIVTALNDEAATGWVAYWTSCGMIESRMARAAYNGAAVAYGTAIEPGAAGENNMGLAVGLYGGLSIAEIQGTTRLKGAWITTQGYNHAPIIYGDPLYRPLA